MRPRQVGRADLVSIVDRRLGVLESGLGTGRASRFASSPAIFACLGFLRARRLMGLAFQVFPFNRGLGRRGLLPLAINGCLAFRVEPQAAESQMLTRARLLTAMSVAAAGWRLIHLRARSAAGVGRARIGSPAMKRRRSSPMAPALS